MPARARIVVPCFNEARRLDAEAFVAFATAHPDVALLFVDDGSTDSTATMLNGLEARTTGITALLLTGHVGKAAAVRLGVLAAAQEGAEFVGFWDADLSTPLSAICEFVEMLSANPRLDIVMGARVKLLGRDVRRRLFRHYAGRVFATAASLALGLAVYDTQCGAKLFRVTEPTSAAFRTPFQSAWIFDVEILARYIAAVGQDDARSRICEIPLHTWTDVPGSKLRLRDGIRAAWDLAKIARAQTRASGAR
ncbi:MAG TPA: glycosyltransferase [Vicinamibacterales bacterium]|jgi:glycosyltransferase involved in cell wall biosynthesis|nr:glycosyltransferase [Vicinamibacterales bacterium]